MGKPVGPDAVEAATWELAEGGRKIGATDYLAAMKWISRYTRRMASWWADGFDLLVTPTIAIPPPEIGYLTPSADNADAL